MRRRPSITLRLALLFAAVSTAVLLAVAALIGYLVDQHFEMLDTVEMEGKASLIRRALGKSQTPADLEQLPEWLDDALVGHHGLSVAVFFPDGRTLYESPDNALPASVLSRHRLRAADRPFVLEQAGQHFRVLVATNAAAIPDFAPFTVAIALDMHHHTSFMSALWQMLAAAVAVGIVLTSLLGWCAAQRGLRPVRAIAGIARGISAERLHSRLPLDSVPAELHDLAESFNDMLARLEDSFRRLSDFSSDIAHELRTPVNTLITQTQVAVTKSRTADEYREVLYSSLEEYERLARMISDMLFIAKTENGLIVPKRELVDLGREADELIEFYQALAEAQGVTVTRTGEGSAAGEQSMIRRAISNLLSNAIRHTPPGGRIVVSVQPLADGETEIAVENTGEAIPPEHLARLFDRFYRVDPSRQRHGEGAGLGLAIVRSIAEAHRGRISARSANGLTRFALTIPTQPLPATP